MLGSKYLLETSVTDLKVNWSFISLLGTLETGLLAMLNFY